MVHSIRVDKRVVGR